ncbi:hypothetical protein CLU79DRAFT_726251 [Phycomyces nitens]|nr:hypothetical protein CLU79DRAFT_726251 [Phycomyces nitens]
MLALAHMLSSSPSQSPGSAPFAPGPPGIQSQPINVQSTGPFVTTLHSSSLSTKKIQMTQTTNYGLTPFNPMSSGFLSSATSDLLLSPASVMSGSRQSLASQDSCNLIDKRESQQDQVHRSTQPDLLDPTTARSTRQSQQHTAGMYQKDILGTTQLSFDPNLQGLEKARDHQPGPWTDTTANYLFPASFGPDEKSSLAATNPPSCGLLELLEYMQSSNQQWTLLGQGNDPASFGLDLDSPTDLHPTFMSPWYDADHASLNNIPATFNHTPAYCIPSVQPLRQVTGQLSLDSLFAMFYGSPRDRLQEIAARELYKRQWRFHKGLKLWLCKEPGTDLVVQTTTCERGSYHFFDPTTWNSFRKEYTVMYDALEIRDIEQQGT